MGSKMVGFQWLDNQGWVQETRFSDGSIIMANFSKQVFKDLPPQSLKAILSDGRVIKQNYAR